MKVILSDFVVFKKTPRDLILRIMAELIYKITVEIRLAKLKKVSPLQITINFTRFIFRLMKLCAYIFNSWILQINRTSPSTNSSKNPSLPTVSS